MLSSLFIAFVRISKRDFLFYFDRIEGQQTIMQKWADLINGSDLYFVNGYNEDIHFEKTEIGFRETTTYDLYGGIEVTRYFDPLGNFIGTDMDLLSKESMY